MNKNFQNAKDECEDICFNPLPDFVCGNIKKTPIIEENELNDLKEIFRLVIKSFSGFTLEDGFLYGEGTLDLRDGNTYEGQVVKGIFHGQGKYLWRNGVIYEGGFENGEIRGQGKFSWPDGSWYSGDVINGKPNGTGKYHQTKPFLMYVGDWVNGERHGKGSEDHNIEGTCFYEGEWKADLPDGQGKLRFQSGNVYEGSFKNGKPHGYGRMEWRNKKQMYEGQWVAGVMEGHGEYYWYVELDSFLHFIQPNIFKGNFVNGQRHGYGICHYGDGSKYEGEWEDNMKNGYGVFFFKNGLQYEANFVNDVVETFVLEEGRESPIRRQEIPHAMIDQKLHEVQGNFCPDLKDIFQCIPWRKWTEQQEKVENIILRHLAFLKSVYRKYSSLGVDEKTRKNRVMDGLQFLQLLRDLELHTMGYSLAKIYRILKKTSFGRTAWDESNIHPWKFMKHLTTVAYFVYRDKNSYDIGESLSELIKTKMKRMKKEMNGVFYSVPERSKFIQQYVVKLRNIFRQICAAHNKDSGCNFLYVRDFLSFWKQLNLYRPPLNTERMVAILSLLIPVIFQDGVYKMDEEMCLLDFIDVVFASAELYHLKEFSKYKLTIKSTLAIGAFLKLKRQLKIKSEGFTVMSKINEENLIKKKYFTEGKPSQMDGEVGALKSTSVSTVTESSFVKKPRHSVIPVISDKEVDKEHDTSDDKKNVKFSPEQVASDDSGNQEIITWLQRVTLFFDQIFIPALDKWSRIEMEAMFVAEERKGLAAAAPSFVVQLPRHLSDARPSTEWLDES